MNRDIVTARGVKVGPPGRGTPVTPAGTCLCGFVGGDRRASECIVSSPFFSFVYGGMPVCFLPLFPRGRLRARVKHAMIGWVSPELVVSFVFHPRARGYNI